MRSIGLYHVGLKVLLHKNNKILFLKETIANRWDLPGGRIDADEGERPLEQIIDRELREELGSDVRYKLGRILFQYRRFVGERRIPVFLTVYGARYLSGKIALSQEHSSQHWVDPKKFEWEASDFLSREEYGAFKKYFS